MSRVYNERNRRPFKFTPEQYAQMWRLIAEYGWSLRGVAKQFGVMEEKDNTLLAEIRRSHDVLLVDDARNCSGGGLVYSGLD